MKEASKPDIGLFLEQHPKSNLDKKEFADNQDQTGSSQLKAEEDKAGAHLRGNETGSFDNWAFVDYDGDEESGAVLEMASFASEEMQASSIGKQSGLVVGSSSKCCVLMSLILILIFFLDDCPIDPVLMTDNVGQSETQALLTLDQGQSPVKAQ